MITCDCVTDEGFKALGRIAQEQPDLYLVGDERRLREAMLQQAGHSELFSQQTISLDASIEQLNQVKVKGHETDAQYAPILREAFSKIPIDLLSDARFWLSLNCFVLARYIPIRWSTSKNMKTKPTKFIFDHYFVEDRESNAGMRLWWLGELARRFAEHTAFYSEEAMLELLSRNVELLHRSLDHRYLLANSRLMTFLWEHAESSERHIFRKPYANQTLKWLNLRAATVSLDLMNDDQLRELVREATPPKKV